MQKVLITKAEQQSYLFIKAVDFSQVHEPQNFVANQKRVTSQELFPIRVKVIPDFGRNL